MYSAPLYRTDNLPHQREREEWVRRLQSGQEREEAPVPPKEKSCHREEPFPGLSGDAALVGLILFLLGDHTRGDTLLICILVYLLFH